jgi:hypothetical protein
MIVNATYVLCTTAPHKHGEKEANHTDKVITIHSFNYNK